MGLPNPSRETEFSGVNAYREIFIFPVQLTTSRIGNLSRLIHTLAYYKGICDYHTCGVTAAENVEVDPIYSPLFIVIFFIPIKGHLQICPMFFLATDFSHFLSVFLFLFFQ